MSPKNDFKTQKAGMETRCKLYSPSLGNWNR